MICGSGLNYDHEVNLDIFLWKRDYRCVQMHFALKMRHSLIRIHICAVINSLKPALGRTKYERQPGQKIKSAKYMARMNALYHKKKQGKNAAHR